MLRRFLVICLTKIFHNRVRRFRVFKIGLQVFKAKTWRLLLSTATNGWEGRLLSNPRRRLWPRHLEVMLLAPTCIKNLLTTPRAMARPTAKRNRSPAATFLSANQSGVSAPSLFSNSCCPLRANGTSVLLQERDLV